MKTLLKHLFTTLIAIVIVVQAHAATGEVTKSGSTWTAKVDGSIKYTGSDMIDAINACTGNMGSGTIHIRNSGDAVAPSGLRQVHLYSNQTIDFHGNTMNCKNALNIYPVKASGKSNLKVKNLKITGVPRYLMHFSNCSNIDISNITANTTRGTGIRVESSRELSISGTIDLHTPGHCIETYTVDGVDVGSVKVRSDNGCGVLFNDSENCSVDAIDAYRCHKTGHYAAFRQANNNGGATVGSIKARECGRGVYIMGGSGYTVINSVDIKDSGYKGISIGAVSAGVRVNSGTVSGTVGGSDIDIWDGASNVCLKVNNGSYGDACSSNAGDSYYSLKNRNSSKCVEVSDGSSSDNANIQQNLCNSSSWRQQWELKDAGDSYLYIKNRNSGKCMRASGDNLVQYTCNSGWWSEMFSRQDVGGGYYLIKNRNTGKCLKVNGSSTSDGASIVLASCNTSYWSQQFSFSSTKSATSEYNDSEPLVNKDVNIYPSIVQTELLINLSEKFDEGATLQLYNFSGKLLVNEKVYSGGLTRMNMNNMPSGIYMVTVSNGFETINQKIIKK
jgi:hypothetical protein